MKSNEKILIVLTKTIIIRLSIICINDNKHTTQLNIAIICNVTEYNNNNNNNTAGGKKLN